MLVPAMILVTRVDAVGQRADQKGKVGEVGVVSKDGWVLKKE